MSMHNPPHPGETVRELCINATGLTVTDAAKVLGVSRQALNNLVNKHASVTPEMAVRLEKAFGSNAETWLRLQMNYDIWQARKNASKIKVERYEFA